MDYTALGKQFQWTRCFSESGLNNLEKCSLHGMFFIPSTIATQCRTATKTDFHRGRLSLNTAPSSLWTTLDTDVPLKTWRQQLLWHNSNVLLEVVGSLRANLHLAWKPIICWSIKKALHEPGDLNIYHWLKKIRTMAGFLALMWAG